MPTFHATRARLRRHSIDRLAGAWPLASLAALLAGARRAREHKHGIQQLTMLDARLLADLGLDQAEIECLAWTGRHRR